MKIKCDAIKRSYSIHLKLVEERSLKLKAFEATMDAGDGKMLKGKKSDVPFEKLKKETILKKL